MIWVAMLRSQCRPPAQSNGAMPIVSKSSAARSRAHTFTISFRKANTLILHTKAQEVEAGPKPCLADSHRLEGSSWHRPYLPLIRRNNRGRVNLMHHRKGVYHPLPIR
jgi:hypothetical protein